MRTLQRLLVTSLLIAVAACGDDDDDGDQGSDPDASPGDPDAGAGDPDSSVACEVAAWSAPNFATNAAGALALRAQLDAVVARMRDAELGTTPVDDIDDLNDLYEAGDLSLASVVTKGYSPVVAASFTDFVALAGAGAQDLIDDNGNWEPGKIGGVFGADARGINVGGLEVRQLVDKGVFGGAGLYAHALELTQGDINEPTIDAIAAAWGGNDALATQGVTDSASYSFAMGFHAEAAAALTAAKSHAADEDCAAERDAALVTFFRLWERSLVARTIFYINSAVVLIEEAPAGAKGDEAKADALHVMGEGLGLTAGFSGLPHPTSGPLSGAGRVLTDENIDEMMTALGVDLVDLSDSETGEFVEDAKSLESGVVSFESIAIEVYELDADEIASYRAPTEG